MKTFLVTGGAGFIGSNLIKNLLNNNNKVICIDNMILGNKENIASFLTNQNFILFEEDISNIKSLLNFTSKENIDYIFHLAANSDIRAGANDPTIDFKNTFQTTYSILEFMRQKKLKKLFFSSTSAVYGEQTNVFLSENAGSLMPISYYGGAKLASEAFISSFGYMNDLDVTIFRFPNVIGPNLTHGVIFDFIKKLKLNSSKLEILGNGTQSKPYIYIDDLIEVILMLAFSSEKGINIYNVGVEGSTSVKDIADMICIKMGLKEVKYTYTGSDRGWKGDVPTFKYDLTKIHQRGWIAKYNSNQAVQATLDAILN
ncbi:NAD-dependent epimerase/dehydratase family protein [Leadbettera azotonutricia]|uniref:dTDP-glucose 4,6-dehydratase n=1 Tax=Leadbettera azotonutricia (strain ATCC BAA-888 / DSM 13862 / ZAS-9) TaxID=545695 RepID=F5YAV3_LEAAZ|nr:NAD-dependent epimerase/dehydratase family protein [Leadbettera azotonutricia]AEF81246.1 dTDP-glucose 4,6-dehydratase [Leadbettera azotonutricia ZAS-9]